MADTFVLSGVKGENLEEGKAKAKNAGDGKRSVLPYGNKF